MPRGIGYDRMGPETKYAGHGSKKLMPAGDASDKLKMCKPGMYNPVDYPSNMRSSDRYPDKAKGRGGMIPPNTTNGGGEATGYTGTRSKDRYPSKVGGSGPSSLPPNTAHRCTEGVALKPGTGYAVGGVGKGRKGNDTPGGYAGNSGGY